METYTNPQGDRRSLTHTGVEVGAENVERRQNAPGREDHILTWECPRKYSRIVYSAGDHLTKFIPRTREEHEGDGNTEQFTVEANIDPPSGKTYIPNMPYQPVVAYDAQAGQQLEVADYDFDDNTVTFETAPDDGTDNVLLWPVLTEGIIKYIGHDQFDNRVASLDQWGIPLHVFNDFEQDRNITKVHLTGAIEFQESERLAVYIDSEHSVVWEDDEFPNGQYATQMEQRVDVDV